MGLDFAWLSPGGAKTPVIELVGGRWKVNVNF